MIKDEFIKIRISKKDKETLMKLSQRENESLSSFILRKSLCHESVSGNTLSQQINTINFINEIYHKVSKSDNEKLRKEVATICNTYLLNQKIRGQ